MVLEIQLRSSVRATSAFHCRAISPAPASWFLYSRLWPAEENDAAIQAGSPHGYHGLSSRFTIKYHSLSPHQPPNSILNHHVCCPSLQESKHQNSMYFLFLQCQAGVLRSRARACRRNKDILGGTLEGSRRSQMVWELSCENVGHLFSACSHRISEAQIAYKVTHFEARGHILEIRLLKEVILGGRHL